MSVKNAEFSEEMMDNDEKSLIVQISLFSRGEFISTSKRSTMFAHLYDQLNALPEGDDERTYQQLLQALFPDPEVRQVIDAQHVSREVLLKSRIAALMLDAVPVVPDKRSVA